MDVRVYLRGVVVVPVVVACVLDFVSLNVGVSVFLSHTHSHTHTRAHIHAPLSLSLSLVTLKLSLMIRTHRKEHEEGFISRMKKKAAGRNWTWTMRIASFVAAGTHSCSCCVCCVPL